MPLRKLTLVLWLASAGLPAQTVWKPFAFLIGTWEATTRAGSSGAAATGTYSFQPELKDHILARHSTNSGCTGPEAFDCAHSDLLYLYRDAQDQSCKAIYFDNEGHVIHYNVSTPTPSTALFLSDPTQPGPQFRLIYERKGLTMVGKFQMRMPGQTEFKSYLEWSGAKKD